MSENLRSQIVTQGVQRSPNRAMLRAVGFKDEDFNKAIVGIANGYSTITPCNMGINQLAQRAEVGIKTAGAMPQMFGTITISDGISMGTEGMKYSLVSREVIADSIETACTGQSMDGVLAIGGCDKNMPGAMLAIARMNIPAIFVYGGTNKPYHEVVCYISSLIHPAREFACGIRGHWIIENRLHWIKNVVMKEDDSKIRMGNAPANLSILRA